MTQHPRAAGPVNRPVAVVTGAAGSIGAALLSQLETAGHDVVGLDLADVLPASDDRFLACDITDEADVTRAFETIMRRWGRIDVLLNNAGISAIGSLADHDIAVWRRVMEVNYTGAVLCTRAALPGLRRSRGRVVVISSVAGFAPVLGRPAYVAAKHAVTGAFEALRPELAADGIGVTLVHPTFVSGGMTESRRPDGVRRATTGPEVTPEQVAGAVVAGVRAGRDRVLVGRTAQVSWWVSRIAPATYRRLMVRRLRGGATTSYGSHGEAA